MFILEYDWSVLYMPNTETLAALLTKCSARKLVERRGSLFDFSAVSLNILAMATATRSNHSTPANKKSDNASFASPTKISRMQERDELGHLNNRLSVYIERVKNLEAENASLSAEIETTKVRTENEVNNMKNMFENELSDARKMLDETSMEKARIQLESGRNASIVAEYKIK